MRTFEEKLSQLDVSLFDAIPTQTHWTDRRSLLAVQRHARGAGSYAYLEIGSHLGGTLQPHFADPACATIYSIDKRPELQPDERGRLYAYKANSTRAMLDNLARAVPGVPAGKVVSFDTDSASMRDDDIIVPPDVCLIDGEHTNAAAIRDFRFCARVASPSALILLHDAGVTLEAIQEIKRILVESGARWKGFKLGGSLYAFAFGEGVDRWSVAMAPEEMDEEAYFRGARIQRDRMRVEARLAWAPPLAGLYRAFNASLDAAYRLYASVLPRNRARGGGAA